MSFAVFVSSRVAAAYHIVKNSLLSDAFYVVSIVDITIGIFESSKSMEKAIFEFPVIFAIRGSKNSFSMVFSFMKVSDIHNAGTESELSAAFRQVIEEL